MAISGISQSDLEALGLALPTPQAATAKKSDLGAADFLKLMTTQLKNQDPFKPLDNGEFLGQLAQFGAVSGINELKTEFQNLSGNIVSGQALQASSLLGREVLVNATSGYLESGRPLAGAVDVPSGAQSVRVAVIDAAGQIVRTIDLGAQAPGLARFSWNGLTDAGTTAAPGQYTVRAQTYLNGQAAGMAPTLIAAPVESVTLGAGQAGMSLSLRGLGDMPFSSVRRIG
ncbi:MAG: flagellar hook assembly protein FlgD [Dehalococcoidia bacterium]